MDVGTQGAWPREPHTVVVHTPDSADRIRDPFAISSASVFVDPPLEFAPHLHPLHELVWVRGGTMTVRVTDRIVTVPEGHGIWIPANTVHSGRTTAGTTLSDALFDPSSSLARFSTVATVAISPLLASLLTHLERTDLTTDERLRAEAVVFDVLVVSDERLSLHVPRSERIGPIVAALIDDPTDDRTVGQWAAILDVSERTVTRIFRAETGMSFDRWRQSLKVHQAVALLGRGHAIHEVSEELGYAYPSSFIAMFKRVVGQTPGSFVRSA